MEKAVLFRIKKDHLDEWRAWCKEISGGLRDEARASLIEEQVIQEATLCFQIGQECYGIGFMDGKALPANPDRTINKKHKEMKQRCIEFISDNVDVLYNIKA